MKKAHALALWGVCGLCAVAAQAACPSWPTAQRFVIHGAEVTDTRTGLVWARCSVGQSWSESSSACTGSPTAHTHEAALQLAAGQSGWRLPNRRELSSLADKGCAAPAIDAVAFPNTPGEVYWTSSPFAANGNDAWVVLFDHGGVLNDYRNYSHHVRLVRASQ